ncbi:MAG: TIGR04283 family arsenosugar biosynthesis glycosyltransferase [Betaproteobacteria bacterium]|nr:TIGR04283 family arsenosugar biosynthesis glycosyltransferase [Betaproteobacteria bacterium]MBU6514166.1 TIGR04283 family arsenosugar biosynthesis glycosyltransferase [Betaproteobacteria bacterium]MDE1956988.1 TIGR04283 family arsenosugar biosynthesis glycosyltransferase [Betaproteobacteria bacterium]MDE2154184.1 TIGR04283 family arsenosugar biosynthesis glycosyltransferase [Betaproteobacteria bacterium]
MAPRLNCQQTWAQRLSIVVPVRNEAAALRQALLALQDLRAAGVELIVVDGCSEDATPDLAQGLADRVLRTDPGRALQMNAGAQASDRALLLFLHIDTALSAGAVPALLAALDGGFAWGRFDVSIEPATPLLRLVGGMMNLRSRISGICTGDQALFMRRDAFDAVGGFPRQDLMEDVEISRRLRRLGRPASLRLRVRTSSRRWLRHGVLRTVLLMWWLRLRYALGAEPTLLARLYREVR